MHGVVHSNLNRITSKLLSRLQSVNASSYTYSHYRLGCMVYYTFVDSSLVFIVQCILEN